MKWLRLLLAAAVFTGANVQAQAQFFQRKPRPTQAQVPELLAASKSDPDERKRMAAVEQLREFDARNHPEVVTALVDILLSDAKSSVRVEAVNSLAKIRPVSQLAGQALEAAAHRDDNWRVRWQAKTSLWSYQMAGYRGSGNPAAGLIAPSTKEPPLADGSIIVVPSTPLPGTATPLPLPLPGTATPLPLPLPGTSGTSALPPTLLPPPPSGTRLLPQGTPVSMPRPLPSRPVPGFTTASPQSPRPAPPPPTTDGPLIVPVQP